MKKLLSLIAICLIFMATFAGEWIDYYGGSQPDTGVNTTGLQDGSDSFIMPTNVTKQGIGTNCTGVDIFAYPNDDNKPIATASRKTATTAGEALTLYGFFKSDNDTLAMTTTIGGDHGAGTRAYNINFSDPGWSHLPFIGIVQTSSDLGNNAGAKTDSNIGLAIKMRMKGC